MTAIIPASQRMDTILGSLRSVSNSTAIQADVQLKGVAVEAPDRLLRRVTELQNSLDRLARAAADPKPAQAASSRTKQSLGLSDSDRTASISSVSSLSGISTGTFEINDTSVYVDVDNDSLAEIVNRINDTVSGVRASLSADNDFIQIKRSNSTSDLKLEDGTSGFFSGVNATSGRFKPVAELDLLSEPERLYGLLRDVQDDLNDLFQPRQGFGQPSLIESIRDRLRGALSSGYQELELNYRGSFLKSDLGIDVDFLDLAGTILQLDQDELTTATSSSEDDLRRLLFRDTHSAKGKGLIPGLRDALGELTGPDGELGRNRGLGRLLNIAA